MINLLPIEDKIEIKKEYLRRIAVAAGIFLFFSVLIAIILLLPSLFLMNNQVKNYERQISLLERRLAMSGMAEVIPAVKELNSMLKDFEGRQKDTGEITGIIEKIIKSAPWGVKLNAFLYNEGMQKDKSMISIRGSSRNRKNLLEFVDILKKIKEFTDVESPASNLLKERNIEFSIFVTLDDYEE